MNSHSILAPSSAARRVACPGSRALEAKYPQPDTDASREGEAAHWVASQALRQGRNFDGIDKYKDEDITGEMIEGAILYFDSIQEVLINYPGASPQTINIETPVSIKTIHPDCWGTPDAWARFGDNLHIWDYKFGHAFVEVFENWQLIEYATGILDTLGVNGIDDQRLFVHFYIVQPRSYHRDGAVRRWSIRASDLRPYFNILRAKEAAALNPDAACSPSPECRYCTARHACEALQRSTLSAVDMSQSATTHDLTAIQTGNELRLLEQAVERLNARITGMQEQALAMLMRGESIPWYRAESSYGRERWIRSSAEVQALGEMMGYKLMKPAEPITPKQAIKLGMDKKLVASFTETPRGALKLVADDGSQARKIFGGNT